MIEYRIEAQYACGHERAPRWVLVSEPHRERIQEPYGEPCPRCLAELYAVAAQQRRQQAGMAGARNR